MYLFSYLSVYLLIYLRNVCDVVNAIRPDRHNRRRQRLIQCPWLAETSAMSIMRVVPTSIAGIAIVWSNFDHFSKNIEHY